MISQKLPNSFSENFDHLEIFQRASDLDKEMMMTPSMTVTPHAAAARLSRLIMLNE